MDASEFEFQWRGDVIRVVVAGDVLALPLEFWSLGGFGQTISVEWLLHEGKLPGPKARREALAHCLVRALDAHHKRVIVAAGDGDTTPRGPSVRCSTCKGSGFVPLVGGS